MTDSLLTREHDECFEETARMVRLAKEVSDINRICDKIMDWHRIARLIQTEPSIHIKRELLNALYNLDFSLHMQNPEDYPCIELDQYSSEAPIPEEPQVKDDYEEDLFTSISLLDIPEGMKKSLAHKGIKTINDLRNTVVGWDDDEKEFFGLSVINNALSKIGAQEIR